MKKQKQYLSIRNKYALMIKCIDMNRNKNSNDNVENENENENESETDNMTHVPSMLKGFLSIGDTVVGVLALIRAPFAATLSAAVLGSLTLIMATLTLEMKGTELLLLSLLTLLLLIGKTISMTVVSHHNYCYYDQ